MTSKLRIVSFNTFPPAYRLVARWAKRHQHRISLVVSAPPSQSERYGVEFQEMLDVLPASQPVLITNRLRKTAASMIAALEPDLIVSAAFPLRIPPEVTSIPRYGALNLHPAPLPRGRGPNPIRLLYEGDMTIAGTVHRIVPEFDAGPILSSKTRQIDDNVMSHDIFPIWESLLDAALEEAAERAVAGYHGEIQDESAATYAAPFTDEECQVAWNEPFTDIRRKIAAVNMLAPRATTSIAGSDVLVKHVRMLTDAPSPEAPGTVLRVDNESAIVKVRDGVVEATIEHLDAHCDHNEVPEILRTR